MADWDIALDQLTNVRHDCRVSPDATDHDVAFADPLDAAEPFFWHTPMVDALHHACQTLPGDTRLRRDLLPSPVMWWWTGPLSVIKVGGSDLSQPLDKCVVVALLVMEAVGRDTPEDSWEAEPDEDPTGLLITSYVIHPSRHRGHDPVPFVGDSVFWEFGQTLDDAQAHLRTDLHDPKNAETLAAGYDPEEERGWGWAFRLAATGLLLFQQRVLIAGRQQASRAARRRAQRPAPRDDHGIVVVTLRHALQVGGGETTTVDWACQWLVRGHWRQQWYPSLNQHQPVFIGPYVKGPEDKPLKPDFGRVFDVKR